MPHHDGRSIMELSDKELVMYYGSRGMRLVLERKSKREQMTIQHYGVLGMKWGATTGGKRSSGGPKRGGKKPSTKLSSNLRYLLPGGTTEAEKAKLPTTASGISKVIEEAIEEVVEEEKKEKSKAATPKKEDNKAKEAKEKARKEKVKQLKEALEGMAEERDKEQEQYKVQVANLWLKVRAQLSNRASQSKGQSDKAKIKELTAEASKKKDEWDSSIKDLEGKLANIETKSDKVSHSDHRVRSIMDLPYKEVIKHYGTKGMRWGVRRKANRYKRAVESDTSAARFIAAKPIRDAVKGIASKVAGSKGAAALKSWKESVDSDTSAAKFIAAKPIRDKLKSVLGSKKGDPAAIQKGKKEHLDSYEDAAKKVESDGAAKIAKTKIQKADHMDSYEASAIKQDRKAEVERGVAKIISDGKREKGLTVSAKQSEALGEKRAAKHDKNAKEIRSEAKTVGKDWDKAISKSESNTSRQAKEIRNEAIDMGKDWDKALDKARLNHGIEGAEITGAIFVENFIVSHRQERISSGS